MNVFYGLVACAALLLVPGAHAQSLTGNVGSAGVSVGEQSIEFRVGVDDQGNAASRLHYDHSFTGWYQLRLISSFSRPDASNWDYLSLTIENWFQWSEEAADQSRFNGGLRLAYGIRDGGGPDEVELRFTLTDKFAEEWEWRTNVIAEMEAGSGSEGGVELETRFQVSRALPIKAFGSDDWRLGVEAFSEYGNTTDIPDLDEQAHQIGPVIKLGWENGVYLQTAVRAGVTNGADDLMTKLFVGREF